jgi:DNA polymerase I-like protein with 3'-5' exonuclease and polymerase domains
VYKTGVPRPSQTLPTSSRRLVACDTETSGLNTDDGARVSIVSVAWEDDHGEIVAYAYPFDQGAGQGGKDGVPASLFDDVIRDDYNLPQQEWDLLLEWLSRQRLVFHNAKFDLHMLRVGTRLWPGRDLESAFMWCCMVAQREIDPGYHLNAAGQLRLKPVCTALSLGGEIEDEDVYAKRLKTWLEKDQRQRRQKGQGRRYDLAPWDLIGPYASQDARLTLLLYWWQIEMLDLGCGRWHLVEHQMRVLSVLYKIERRGIGYDAAASLTAAGEVRDRIDALVADLPFKNTLPAAKRYFFDEGRCLVYKRTAKGAVTLDNEVLRKMVGDGIKWAHEFQEIARLEKSLSMWLVGYPDKIGIDGRLRTEFQQTKVRSGRMSSQRMNLQAVPKGDKTVERGLPDVRGFFRARDGYRLWNLDLSQAELRVAAKYAGCRQMLAMLADGADLHTITTGEVLGAKPGDDGFEYKRDIGKRLTLGGIFLIGARTFQADLRKHTGIEMPLSECDRIVSGWRNLYPEYGRAYRRSQNYARQNGYVKLLEGTEYESLSRFGPLDYDNTAWSRRVQGSLAAYLGIWLVEAEGLLGQWDVQVAEALVLTVHDSLVLELPDDERGPQVAQAVALAGARRATEIFEIEMLVDWGPWHKGSKGLASGQETGGEWNG